MRERRLATHALAVLALVTMLVVGSAAVASPSGGNPHQPPPTTTTTAVRTATTTTVLPPVLVVIPGCAVSEAGQCPNFTWYSELSGRLTTVEGVPLAGRTLQFLPACSAITDATGVARCLIDLGLTPLSSVSAEFAGDGTYAPSSGDWSATP